MELFVFLVIDGASFVSYQCNDVKGLSIAWELPLMGVPGRLEICITNALGALYAD